MEELKQEVEQLRARTAYLWTVFDIEGKKLEVEGLEKEASKPGLWNDSRSAQSTMRRLSGLNEEITLWSGLESSVGDLDGLIDLSVETGDLSLESQIVEEISDLHSRLKRLEFNLA